MNGSRFEVIGCHSVSATRSNDLFFIEAVTNNTRDEKVSNNVGKVGRTFGAKRKSPAGDGLLRGLANLISIYNRELWCGAASDCNQISAARADAFYANRQRFERGPL